MRTRTVVAAVAALALLAGSCGPVLVVSGAAAGGGAILWYRGWLRQTVDQPIDRVHRAARAALADCDVALEDEGFGSDHGFLDGYAKDTRRVVVKTLRLGDTSTQVRIRVGLWGDQQQSVRILDQLKKHL